MPMLVEQVAQPNFSMNIVKEAVYAGRGENRKDYCRFTISVSDNLVSIAREYIENLNHLITVNCLNRGKWTLYTQPEKAPQVVQALRNTGVFETVETEGGEPLEVQSVPERDRII